MVLHFMGIPHRPISKIPTNRHAMEKSVTFRDKIHKCPRCLTICLTWFLDFFFFGSNFAPNFCFVAQIYPYWQRSEHMCKRVSNVVDR